MHCDPLAPAHYVAIHDIRVHLACATVKRCEVLVLPCWPKYLYCSCFLADILQPAVSYISAAIISLQQASSTHRCALLSHLTAESSVKVAWSAVSRLVDPARPLVFPEV